ncbi:hypothetical protein E6O75_ATG07110 [Venturia nashicola]|uniref:Uncharacterized protein n=1 Tax=Venturia nashicola TaxID=86259 RepID=A0A4Z1NXD6_9PEZI|nr:hypothetical protein E6O75_ATG07110 [Venturia nashicola]
MSYLQDAGRKQILCCQSDIRKLQAGKFWKFRVRLLECSFSGLWKDSALFCLCRLENNVSVSLRYVFKYGPGIIVEFDPPNLRILPGLRGCALGDETSLVGIGGGKLGRRVTLGVTLGVNLWRELLGSGRLFVRPSY